MPPSPQTPETASYSSLIATAFLAFPIVFANDLVASPFHRHPPATYHRLLSLFPVHSRLWSLVRAMREHGKLRESALS